MIEIDIKGVRVQFDPIATAKAYQAIEHGDPERCGCLYCRNYAANREIAHPAAARDFLLHMGVDWTKESEVFEAGRMPGGEVFYSGWWNVVGSLPAGKDLDVLEVKATGYKLSVGHVLCEPPSAFKGNPEFAVQFAAYLPWTVPEPYPGD